MFLSHYVDCDTPMYGNDGVFSRDSHKSTNRGDTANSERWSLNNHTGTHIDFPRHFFSDGKSLNDFSADFFIVNRAYLLDFSQLCRPALIFNTNHFNDQEIPEDTEALLLKTGFENFRNEEIYWRENPGYAPELYAYFRQRCPELRFFGFDSISLTSFMHRDTGREAHRAFLGSDNPILPIEDMRLEPLKNNVQISSMMIAPILIRNADGGPVSVIADISNGSK